MQRIVNANMRKKQFITNYQHNKHMPINKAITTPEEWNKYL